MVLLAVLAAACSSENDGDALSPRDEGKGQEYAAAISTAAQKDDPDDDNDPTFSPDAADCYGRAFVEVLGVERFEAAVTPEEIAAGDEADAADWGVKLSDDEGVEVFRALVDCDPGVMAELGASLGGNATPIDLDADCLAETDPADIEDYIGSAIAAAGEDELPTREAAAAWIDWMMGCGDLKPTIIDDIVGEADNAPAGLGACLDERLDDDMIRGFMIARLTSDEDDIGNAPGSQAFIDVVTRCALEPAGGG